MDITSVMTFLKDVLQGIGVLGYLYTTFAVAIGLTALSIVVRAVRS